MNDSEFACYHYPVAITQWKRKGNTTVTTAILTFKLHQFASVGFRLEYKATVCSRLNKVGGRCFYRFFHWFNRRLTSCCIHEANTFALLSPIESPIEFNDVTLSCALRIGRIPKRTMKCAHCTLYPPRSPNPIYYFNQVFIVNSLYWLNCPNQVNSFENIHLPLNVV